MQINITFNGYQEMRNFCQQILGQTEEKKPEPLTTQIVETMKTEPKKNGRQSKNELDDGKIKALREAGWTISKIADEFGASEATICNHLKKMGLSGKERK